MRRTTAATLENIYEESRTNFQQEEKTNFIDFTIFICLFEKKFHKQNERKVERSSGLYSHRFDHAEWPSVMSIDRGLERT